MADMEKGEIRDLHDVEGPWILQDHDDDDDDNEVIIGSCGPKLGADGALMIIMKVWMIVNQKVMMTTTIKCLVTQ